MNEGFEFWRHLFCKISQIVSVHKYGHVVLRVLFTSCTPKRNYAMPVKAVEDSTNEPNESKQI